MLAVRTSLIPFPHDRVPSSVSPEALLAMAMIARALDDLAGQSLLSSDRQRSRAYTAQREARRWIAGAPARLTFEFACILASLERRQSESGLRSCSFFRAEGERNVSAGHTLVAGPSIMAGFPCGGCQGPCILG